MDEMIQAQKIPENARQLDQPQIDESPKEHGRIRKILNASSWFVFFTFLPVTVLILLSQNTIPGDLFYPIKRGMENVVLAAASVSPATRVAFRTDLTERRFGEAEKLLLARADTTGLSDFVEEVQTAQQEISALSNSESKQELTEKLVRKIDEYQNKLVQVQAKRQSNIAFAPLPTNTPIPTSISTTTQIEPTKIPVSQITNAPQQNPTAIPFIKASPTKVPTNISFSTPTSSQQIISPKPTSAQPSLSVSIEPTSAAAPTIEPSATQTQTEPTPTVSPTPPNNVGTAIDDAQKRLEEVKDKLKEGPRGRRDKKEKNRSQKEK